jgi:hypothetical protein
VIYLVLPIYEELNNIFRFITHIFGQAYSKYNNKLKKFQNQNFKLSHTICSSGDTLSVLPYLQLCLSHCVFWWVFPYINFVKTCIIKSNWCPESNIKVNVFNLSIQVEILDLLKGDTSLGEVVWQYGKNELHICSTELKSAHSEHSGLPPQWSPGNQRPANAKGLSCFK